MSGYNNQLAEFSQEDAAPCSSALATLNTAIYAPNSNTSATFATPAAAGGPAHTGSTVKSNEYEQLLDEKKQFKAPINNYDTLRLYNDAFLARNNQEVDWPLDLPKTWEKRQVEANRFLTAFTNFDPEIEYPGDQACRSLGRQGNLRYGEAEMMIRSWELQKATEEASKGICKIPRIHGDKFPKYEKFDTHSERVELCVWILTHNKKVVLNILTKPEYLVRFPWNPKEEDTKIVQNEKSAAAKKERHQKANPATKVEEEKLGNDKSDEDQSTLVAAQTERSKKRARTRTNQNVAPPTQRTLAQPGPFQQAEGDLILQPPRHQQQSGGNLILQQQRHQQQFFDPGPAGSFSGPANYPAYPVPAFGQQSQRSLVPQSSDGSGGRFADQAPRYGEYQEMEDPHHIPWGDWMNFPEDHDANNGQ
ncbi:hypothetical protein F5Y18DRAFT_425521 [Xylariaceae sp. FL1019]|nr:hypothetical protein F5Y18DRAFT_425521 [Xylariaceae sp. FL1019]